MIDLKEIEKEILEFWKKNKIWEKAKEKNSNGKKFYFLQGPPYTSGKLHIGHAWNNSLKDVIMRYKRLKGFDVWDRAGYDMHGLPTENKVQKELKLEDKKAIVEYGLDKFSNACLKFSKNNAKIMNEDMKRLGIWMDFENAYLPVENQFMASEWGLIKEAQKQGRLYKGKKIMQWCSTCETSLAKHELEYKDVRDTSIYVKFKLKDKDEFLLIWTTTPWTIPFNLAVMVNPELDYVKVDVEGEVYVVAKELAERVFSEIMQKNYVVLEEFKGKDMEGWEYEHPFSDIINYEKLKKEAEKIHTILLSKEYVNLDAGSGLVHCAPGCGPEDFEVGKKYGIMAYNSIDEKGIFNEAGKFDGLVAKKNDVDFIKELDSKGALVAKEKVSHEYAHCWRCGEPIVFRATEQWFLKTEDLIPKIIEYDKKINWVPESAKKSYELWIENLKDNGLTRQRFWGTPMPIWECECGKIKVIGSEEELRKEAINEIPSNFHKPWIDSVKLKCECGKEMTRTPDILDVWIDSGTVSWNCLYYPERKDYFKKYFPADLILEATEQTRLWFSMLQICSEILFKKPCYENVYAHGMIFDFQGTKMSKSLGNIISPYEVVDKYSSDIFRYYICQIKAGENINFSWEDIKQKQRNLNVLLNIHNYLLSLLNSESSDKNNSKEIGLEERYILSRMNSVLKTVGELFDSYRLDETIGEMEKLFLDLSRVYIKMTRDKSNEDETRNIVLNAIQEVYLTILKIFSPICPLITENLWQELKEKKIVKEESIHLSSWPKTDLKKIDLKLEKEMESVLKIIEAGLAERDKVQIGLKWPLAKATVFSEEKISKELLELIERQLNVKKIELKNGKELKVELDLNVSAELEAEGYSRNIARNVQAFRKELGLEKKDLIELSIRADKELNEMLKTNEDFLKERTNSSSINFYEENVTTEKERFKKNKDFKIKNKRGEIGIVII
jgi:isoleucyl-tRNA synthetase